MKKTFASILFCAMLLALLPGCVSTPSTEVPNVVKPTDDNSNQEVPEIVPTEALSDPTEADSTPATGYITSKEDFVSVVSKLIDLSLYDDLYEDIDDDNAYYSFDIDYDNETTYNLDYSIILSDGTAFTMPYPIAELAKKGWSISDTAASREIEAGLMSWAWCENTNNQEIYITACNPTEETVTFGDCSVCEIEIKFYDSLEHVKYEKAPGFTICGGITEYSKLEDIISTLGNPSCITLWIDYDENGNYEYAEIEVEYCQPDNAYEYLEFTLSGDGNYIVSIRYKNIPK